MVFQWYDSHSLVSTICQVLKDGWRRVVVMRLMEFFQYPNVPILYAMNAKYSKVYGSIFLQIFRYYDEVRWTETTGPLKHFVHSSLSYAIPNLLLILLYFTGRRWRISECSHPKVTRNDPFDSLYWIADEEEEGTVVLVNRMSYVLYGS